MSPSPFRVVLDTNILVRGLINLQSHSGRVLRACEDRRMIALLSKELISEYRYMLTDPILVARYPELVAAKTKTAIERLVYVGEVVQTRRIRFEFPRDVRDEKLITLAIAGAATHLVTTDRDLLDLPAGHTEAAKRFRQRLPRVVVLRPEELA